MKSTQSLQNIGTSNQSFSRLVKLMLAAVVGVTLLFGAYYYWDRYIHLGDKSPVELSVAEWQQAVQDNPSDPSARLNLAQHLIAKGEFTQAAEQAQEVLSAYPDSDGALLVLGIANTRLNQPQEAAGYLERYVALKQVDDGAPKDMVLEASLFYLGQNYLVLQKPEQAVSVLLEALHIDPTDADALHLLGNAYAQTSQHDLAVQAYQNAVRFVPNFAEAYQGMQASFTVLGKADLALYAQGMEAYSTGDFEKAREVLDKAVQNLSEYAPVYLGLALTYEKLGELELAQISARKVLELAPDDFAANSLLTKLQSNGQ